MLIVILALGTTDLLFALDSIPAIYGLTKEPYLVLTANIFALMGLRQLYFLIGGLLKKLVYLSIGLAVLLAFIGVKLVMHALHENNLPFINGGRADRGRARHPDRRVARSDRPHPRRHDDRQPLEVGPRRPPRTGGRRACCGFRRGTERRPALDGSDARRSVRLRRRSRSVSGSGPTSRRPATGGWRAVGAGWR